MSNQELLDYISLFREKAEQGKLVIFVGAGVSCNVEGMPDWNMLIQNMADAIGYSKCISCKRKCKTCEESCLLKNDYSTDELLKIPQYVFNKDRELYSQILKTSIPPMEADAPLSSAIFDINPSHIITTNYDHLLEASKNIFCEQYQVIIHDRDLLNSEKSKYIIKMHGDISVPDSLVLKEQDYLDYSQTHVLIELFVKSLLTDHVVLFLGYSLNDYNIKLILSWLNYMRSQNESLNEEQKVGYIVLDQDELDTTQLSYFNRNNVGVINIKSMPLIQIIPETLFCEKGKRLYSFLSVIANPALEEGLASIENAVKLLSQHTFVSYEQLLKLLHIRSYDVRDWSILLFSQADYTRLTAFMNAKGEEPTKLKQLFVNAGILSIEYHDIGCNERYTTGKASENILFQDKLFNLYISNKYDEIKLLIDDESIPFDHNKRCFYRSIISGYHKGAEEYDKPEQSMSAEQKVTYLHNTAVIQALTVFPPQFESNKVKQFIQNISSVKERELFSGYLDIYNGNTQKRLAMQTALEKLKKDVQDKNTIHFGGTSCAKIYEIKRLAMTQYFFYFNNCILYQGFRDLSDFFKPYIEAIICSNCDAAEKPSHFGNLEFGNEKYLLEYVDLDIISKFISTKDLNALIGIYKIKKLNIEREKIGFLTECFQNISVAITRSRLYGFRQSSLSTLSNLLLLLNLVDLDEDNKNTIKSSIDILMGDEDLVHALFSIHCPDFRLALEALSKFCHSLDLSCHFDAVQRIISNKDFFEYAINVRFGSLRRLITALLSNCNGMGTFNNIQSIIDKTENVHHKVILLRLFYQSIEDEKAKESYKKFLIDNFSALSTEAIYDFVFSGWLSLTPNAVTDFFDGILKANRHSLKGVQSFPDLVESKMECVYLLYISGIVDDLSPLKELAEGRPHLQFLLNPDHFDYAQVDFSNYMWENFARHEKCMKHFIAHKDIIVSNIKKRIDHDDVSEAEKRILYGFLLNENEIWEV